MRSIYLSLYYLAILVVSLIITSCKNHDSNRANLASDTLLTKTIMFPDNLLKLNGTQFQDPDSFIYEIEDKTKIISIIDGDCIKCIVYQLNQIDSIFNNILFPLPDDDNVLIFILNVHSEDSVYFIRYIQPAIKATGVILWDNNYNFERQNHILTRNVNLRTFMVNNENRIIHYGNPIMHPDVVSEYQDKLLSKYIADSIK